MRISDKIKDRLRNENGRIGICFCDINKDTSIFVGNNDVFPSLGIAKFILMIEFFNQIEKGMITPEDTYLLGTNPVTVPKEEYEENVGIVNLMRVGRELTMEELLMFMMVISDNEAFNILLTKLGIENINITMKKLGLTNTRINCALFKGIDKKPEIGNYHSVREIAALLKLIYKKQLISSVASEKMMELMSYHQRREVMSEFMNRKVSVLQQTGFDMDALHCVAIIMEKNPFILSMSADEMDPRKAEGVFRDVARMCKDNVEGK